MRIALLGVVAMLTLVACDLPGPAAGGGLGGWSLDLKLTGDTEAKLGSTTGDTINYCTGKNSKDQGVYQLSFSAKSGDNLYDVALGSRLYDGPGKFDLSETTAGDHIGPGYKVASVGISVVRGGRAWQGDSGSFSVNSDEESGTIDATLLRQEYPPSQQPATMKINGKWSCRTQPAPKSADPAQAQDLTFSGDFNGHMTTDDADPTTFSRTAECSTPAPGNGAFSLRVGGRAGGLFLSVRTDISASSGGPGSVGYTGPGTYSYTTPKPGRDLISPQAFQNQPAQAGVTASVQTAHGPRKPRDWASGSDDKATITVDQGEQSGTIDAATTILTEFPKGQDSGYGSSHLQVKGRWACTKKQAQPEPSPPGF